MLWRNEHLLPAGECRVCRHHRRYVDLLDGRMEADTRATERRTLALFGCAAKGRTRSLLEPVIAMTGRRGAAADIHQIVALGKRVLPHPVELVPDMREVIEPVECAIRSCWSPRATSFVMKKVDPSEADLFQRTEIVSGKKG